MLCTAASYVLHTTTYEHAIPYSVYVSLEPMYGSNVTQRLPSATTAVTILVTAWEPGAIGHRPLSDIHLWHGLQIRSKFKERRSTSTPNAVVHVQAPTIRNTLWSTATPARTQLITNTGEARLTIADRPCSHVHGSSKLTWSLAAPTHGGTLCCAGQILKHNRDR
jgi:hypothetical protein